MIRTLKASTYAWLVLLVGFYSEGCFGLTDRSDARAQPAESGVELDVVTIDTPQRDGSTSDADAAVVDAIDRVDVSITPDMPSIIEDSGMCPMGTRACAMVGCVNLQSNASHCGACSMPCTLANATSVCTNGACEVSLCDVGFSNCDGMIANGCEVNTNNNVNHCNGCGMQCVAVNGVPSCSNGGCGIASCSNGFGNCDMNQANGCETNTASNLEHCGGCGMVCPAVNNGTPACVAGSCRATCNMGFESVGPGCIRMGAFPRPIQPLSLGDVSLRRPTLRWVLPQDATGAFVELCSDRACAAVIGSIRAVGTSTRPVGDLPAAGVVFWRLRAMIGMGVAATFSPTWLFHLPRTDNSRGIDTSTNPHLDLNGDGIDDVVVGALASNPRGRFHAGTAAVHLGTRGGNVAPPSVLEGTAPNDLFGNSVATAGDTNGDGFGDIIVGAYQADPGGMNAAGAATVFYGGPARAPTVLSGDVAIGWDGAAVASAGDVNGDGYADVIVGAPGTDGAGRTLPGRAKVYWGAAAGTQVAMPAVFTGPAVGSRFGVSVATVGDVNGDGLSDFIVGAQSATVAGRTEAGTASVFYGDSRGNIGAPTVVLEGPAAFDNFGFSVAGAGDVDNDGFSDFLVGAPWADPMGRPSAGTATLFYGSNMGIDRMVARVLEGGAAGDFFGVSVSSAGDLNGNGYDDIAVGSIRQMPPGRMAFGIVSIFLGTNMGLSPMPSQTLDGSSSGDWFGFCVASGDVNGDSYSDLILGAPFADPPGLINAGTASIFYGSMMGVPMLPSQVLLGSEADANFGLSLASLRPRRSLPLVMAQTLLTNIWFRSYQL